MNADAHDPTTTDSSKIVWRPEWLDEVDSTNQIAADRIMHAWARGESAEGLVILARRQRAGRGQHGRTWESPPGGLYFSAVLEGMPPDVRDRLALLGGLAVAEGLDLPETYENAAAATREKWRVHAGIRWPNDIMVGKNGDKKIAGVLCEAVAQGDRWATITGIGVNVMTEMNALPANLQSRALSLTAHDARQRTIEGVANAILQRLAAWTTQVRNNGLAQVITRVRQRDALVGKRIRFDAADPHRHDRIFDATAEGIDDEGRLLLRHDDQKLEAFARGTILIV